MTLAPKWNAPWERRSPFQAPEKEMESLTFSTTNRYPNSLSSLFSVQSLRHSLQGPGFLLRAHTHSAASLWALGIRNWQKKIPENPISSLLSERTKGRKVGLKMTTHQIRYSEWLETTKGEDYSIPILSIHFCLSCGSGQCLRGCRPEASTPSLVGTGGTSGSEHLLSSHQSFSSSAGLASPLKALAFPLSEGWKSLDTHARMCGLLPYIDLLAAD